MDYTYNGDAGVFKINEDLAVVSTVDFFTPILDIPFYYGEIAVANSLSDIYAMGAKPISALNVIGFNKKIFPMEVIAEILKGGASKLAESGTVLLGGHTIQDKEIFYGASVTGLINPVDLITNRGAKEGSILVLTKPLGTGVITTALMAKMLGMEQAMDCINNMRALNNIASEIMVKYKARAATDITGFGFIGHSIELAEASNVSLKICFSKMPVDKLAFDIISKGIYPGGSLENQSYFASNCKTEAINEIEKAILYDAQTSGGLLIAFDESIAEKALAEMQNRGVSNARIIGEVIPRGKDIIIVER